MSSLERPPLDPGGRAARGRARHVHHPHVPPPLRRGPRLHAVRGGRVHERPRAAHRARVPERVVAVDPGRVRGGELAGLARRADGRVPRPRSTWPWPATWSREGLIFVPMLLIAQFMAPGTIQAAAFRHPARLHRPHRHRASPRAGISRSWARSSPAAASWSLGLPSSAGALFGFQLGHVLLASAMVVAGRRLDPARHVEGAEPLSGGPVRGRGRWSCSPEWRCCSGTCCGLFLSSAPLGGEPQPTDRARRRRAAAARLARGVSGRGRERASRGCRVSALR